MYVWDGEKADFFSPSFAFFIFVLSVCSVWPAPADRDCCTVACVCAEGTALDGRVEGSRYWKKLDYKKPIQYLHKGCVWETTVTLPPDNPVLGCSAAAKTRGGGHSFIRDPHTYSPHFALYKHSEIPLLDNHTPSICGLCIQLCAGFEIKQSRCDQDSGGLRDYIRWSWELMDARLVGSLWTMEWQAAWWLSAVPSLLLLEKWKQIKGLQALSGVIRWRFGSWLTGTINVMSRAKSNLAEIKRRCSDGFDWDKHGGRVPTLAMQDDSWRV